jgi:hypothetical protein
VPFDGGQQDFSENKFRLRGKPAPATVGPMAPIDEHLARNLSNELRAMGVAYAAVAVLSAEAENWRYRVAAQDRTFEMGFNHRELLWCRETTPGRRKHLVSNDHPPLNDSRAARSRGVALIRRALADPTFPPRDPPVI